MFYVNQKIICVDAISGPGEWLDGEALTDGAIYTVKRVWVDANGNPVLDLVEISRNPRSHIFWKFPVGYCQFRFRPLTERKHSTEAGVELLRKIARDVPVRERV